MVMCREPMILAPFSGWEAPNSVLHGKIAVLRVLRFAPLKFERANSWCSDHNLAGGTAVIRSKLIVHTTPSLPAGHETGALGLSELDLEPAEVGLGDILDLVLTT